MLFETFPQRIDLKESASVSLFNNGDGVFEMQISVKSGINMLGEELIVELQQAMDKVQEESSIKVLLISGSEGSFLFGGSHHHNVAVERKFYQSIASFPYPIIASMKGDAIGAGFLVGALCDFMICSLKSLYGYTNHAESVFPTLGEDAFFKERFGAIQSTDLLYHSVVGSYTGEQLKEKGWSCAIVPRDEVEKHVESLASNLSMKTQKSLRLLKQHLARKITPLVDGFGVIKGIGVTIPGVAAHWNGAIAPVNQLRIEIHGDKTILLEMR